MEQLTKGAEGTTLRTTAATAMCSPPQWRESRIVPTLKLTTEIILQQIIAKINNYF